MQVYHALGVTSARLVFKLYKCCYRDIVPLGQNKSNFNYNLDEKRVLNFENIVDDSDNVKQDMSIDVYGRKAEGEGDSKKSPATAEDAKVQTYSNLAPRASAHERTIGRHQQLPQQLMMHPHAVWYPHGIPLLYVP